MGGRGGRCFRSSHRCDVQPYLKTVPMKKTTQPRPRPQWLPRRCTSSSASLDGPRCTCPWISPRVEFIFQVSVRTTSTEQRNTRENKKRNKNMRKMRAEQCCLSVSQMFGHLYLEVRILENICALGDVLGFGTGYP